MDFVAQSTKDCVKETVILLRPNRDKVTPVERRRSYFGLRVIKYFGPETVWSYTGPESWVRFERTMGRTGENRGKEE
ncbi:unnamed protein product [Camellia sinensis]